MRIKHKIHRFLFRFCEVNERDSLGKACGAALTLNYLPAMTVARLHVWSAELIMHLVALKPLV